MRVLNGMRIKLHIARPDEAPAIAELHAVAARHLTSQHGQGFWSKPTSEKGVRFNMRNGTVYIARKRNKLIATLTLATKKPWAIDRKYFSKLKLPLYLIGMAVAPDEQRKGIGRLCLKEVGRIASQWGVDAIRLDAYDAVAGAGGFYRKCGFREVGRAAYKGAPLIYFELLL
jgi:GNAT superfamily N-acetyltransferase